MTRMLMNAENPHALAERARYALLCRLAPALRHETVGPLQPIVMTAGLLERRLRDPSAKLDVMQESAARLTGLSRAAVQSCLELIAWLTPEPGRLVPLHEAVRDTLDLMRGSFALRGFTLRDELDDAREPVRHASLRYVLPACLLWLTDRAGSPAEVTLRAQTAGKHLQLVLDLQPSEGGPGMDDTPAYRPLCGEEVQALATDEAIELEQGGDTLVLTMPRANAGSNS